MSIQSLLALPRALARSMSSGVTPTPNDAAVSTIARRYDRDTSASTPSMSNSSAAGASAVWTDASRRASSASDAGTPIRSHSPSPDASSNARTLIPKEHSARHTQRVRPPKDAITKFACESITRVPRRASESAIRPRRATTVPTSTGTRSAARAARRENPEHGYGPPVARVAWISDPGPIAYPTRIPARP